MRHILYTLLLACAAIQASAQEETKLVVKALIDDSQEVSYDLNARPKLVINHAENKAVFTFGEEGEDENMFSSTQHIRLSIETVAVTPDEPTTPDEPEEPIEDLALADGEAYERTENVEVKHLTYTRTFNNTDWQPLYVPFSMACSDWTEQGLEVACINGFYEYDDYKNGTINRSALEVIRVTEEDGLLLPNFPYLIRARETGEKTIALDDVTLSPAEDNSGDCSTFRTKYIFTGTYAGVSQSELNEKAAYIMGGGKLTPSAGGLRPMRWYMTREGRGNLFLPRLAEIKIFVHGEENTADALDFANAETSTDGQTYDLTGRKASRNAKGIFIRNGKKIVK